MHSLVLIFESIIIIISFIQVHAKAAYCNQSLYGRPELGNCLAALSNLHAAGGVEQRLFVEQQLRAKLSPGDWQPIADPRPQGQREEIVQVPKLWNYGM